MQTKNEKYFYVIGLKQGLSFRGLWPFYLKTEDFIFYFLMQKYSRVLFENTWGANA